MSARLTLYFFHAARVAFFVYCYICCPYSSFLILTLFVTSFPDATILTWESNSTLNLVAKDGSIKVNLRHLIQALLDVMENGDIFMLPN